MRVLLLNPPGREIYIRDYFCSQTTQPNYYFHPVDLLALSGTLAQEHEVAVLDCIAECQAKIQSGEWQFEFGELSKSEDKL